MREADQIFNSLRIKLFILSHSDVVQSDIVGSSAQYWVLIRIIQCKLVLCDSDQIPEHVF